MPMALREFTLGWTLSRLKLKLSNRNDTGSGGGGGGGGLYGGGGAFLEWIEAYSSRLTFTRWGRRARRRRVGGRRYAFFKLCGSCLLTVSRRRF